MDKVNFMCYPIKNNTTEKFFDLTSCKANTDVNIQNGFKDKYLIFSPSGPAWCQFAYRFDIFPTTFKKDGITTLMIPGIKELKINTSNIPTFGSNQTYHVGDVVNQADSTGKVFTYLNLTYDDPRGQAYNGSYQWDPNGDSKIIWKKIFLI
jgi:hypothetical protein